MVSVWQPILAERVRRAWEAFRSEYPDHVPYAVILDGEHGSPVDLVVQVLTEQGLTEVAERYIARDHYDDLGEARRELRWSIADSPLQEFFLEHHGSSTLDGEHASPEELFAAAAAALRQLDEEGIFGRGADRERLVVAAFPGDAISTRRMVAELNPAVTLARYDEQTSLPGDFTNAGSLVLSPDGQRFWLSGSRANPGEGGEFLSRIAAYDAASVPRWAVEWPSFGDSIRQLALPGAGEVLFAARLRYPDKTAMSSVMRLRSRDGGLIDELPVPGEVAALAVRADGGLVAVTSHDGRLTLLDPDTGNQRGIDLSGHPAGLRFLRDGTLLIATDAGLWRLVDGDAEPALAVRGPAFRLSTDRADGLLAISRRGMARPLFGQAELPVFGVTVVPLSDLGAGRTYGWPDTQAEIAELSPDGRRLAFAARSTRTVRKSLIVLDLESGRALVHQRHQHVADLVFTPDSRTLLVATSGHRPDPPVDAIPISD